MKMVLVLVLSLTLTISTAVSNSPPVAYKKGSDCLTCHSDKHQKLAKHVGVLNNNCNYCHELGTFGSAPENNIADDSQECSDCHLISGMFPISQAHETLPCLKCHDPHSSDFNHLLRNSSVVLCTEECHGPEELGNSHLVGSNYTDRKTGTELTCTTTCHRIHSPQSDKLLSAAPPGLCFLCHSDKF